MCESALVDINEIIARIIDIAPHFNEIGISQTKLSHLSVEMIKKFRSIQKRRDNLILEGQNDPEQFHLITNVQ